MAVEAVRFMAVLLGVLALCAMELAIGILAGGTLATDALFADALFAKVLDAGDFAAGDAIDPIAIGLGKKSSHVSGGLWQVWW